MSTTIQITNSTISTISTTANPPFKPTTEIVNNSNESQTEKFAYPIVVLVSTWIALTLIYVLCRWRQKAKNQYIIPRVFVLCSPRTVQFHYELILRIGLPSNDFNPDKHDIDVTVLGQQNNEVVPMTRLNTKTLLDEPLITNLSIVVYRLVELPQLGGLILKHSGPFKSWIYVYDFTVIDLSTNKEQYYTINQYVGSLEKTLNLNEPSAYNVHYPIDDVPLPEWSIEDIFLFLYFIINSIMLSITLMPINCNYMHDILTIFLTSFGIGTLVFFVTWFLHYYLAWQAERKEYFNDFVTNKYLLNDFVIKIIIFILSTAIGGATIYFSLSINNWKESLVWLLCILNSCTMLVGLWNACRQIELGDSIVNLGLRMKGTEVITTGMRYSELVGSNLHTKSGSTSDDSYASSSKLPIGIGPRSSVKSFGFDPITGHLSHKLISRFAHSRISSTGATPNNQPALKALRPAAASSSQSTGGAKDKHKSHHDLTQSSDAHQSQQQALRQSEKSIVPSVKQPVASSSKSIKAEVSHTATNQATHHKSPSITSSNSPSASIVQTQISPK